MRYSLNIPKPLLKMVWLNAAVGLCLWIHGFRVAIAMPGASSIQLAPLEEEIDLIYDNPWSVLNRVKAIAENASIQTHQPELFVRACVLTVLAERELNFYSLDTRLVQHCTEVALQHDMKRYLVELYAHFADKSNDNSEFDKSEQYLALAEKIARDLGERSVQSYVLHQQSSRYRKQGQSAEALKLMRDALEMAPDSQDIRVHILKNRLAQFYEKLGDVARSSQLYLGAYQYAQNQKMRYMASFVAHNLARLYEKSEPTNALRYYDASIAFAREIQDHEGVAFALLGKAKLSLPQGELILPWLEEAFSTFGVTQNRSMQAEVQVEMAKFHGAKGRHQEAIDRIDQAIKLYPDIGYFESLVIAYSLLSEQHKALGNYKSALESFQKSTHFANLDFEVSNKRELVKLQGSLNLQLEEHKNILLTKENEIQAAKIREAQNTQIILLSISGLSGIVIISLLGNISKSRQIRTAQLQMQRILDQIEEGIVTFGRDFKIEAFHSVFMEKIFEHNEEKLAGVDILQLLFRSSEFSADQINVMQSAFESVLGEDQLAWDLNSGHFPHEIPVNIHGQRKHLVAHWQPVQDLSGKLIHKIMLSIRDETATRSLQETLKVEQERHERMTGHLLEIIHAPLGQVQLFLSSSAEKLSKIREALQSDAIDAPGFLRDLHTIKGAARTLKMSRFSNLVHQAESFILHNSDIELDVETFSHQVGKICDLHAEYSAILPKLPGVSYQRTLQGHSLLHILSKYIPDAQRNLQEHGHGFAGYTLDDQVSIWPAEIMEDVDEALMHALNNSIDHGFIRPSTHDRKMPPAQFGIAAYSNGAMITLELRDNGAGLDGVKLRELAVKKGYHIRNEQDLWNVVFLDGVSTAEHVTLSSGRGVGMSAIRSICEKRGGSAEIMPNDLGRGALLKLKFPAHGNSTFVQNSLGA